MPTRAKPRTRRTNPIARRYSPQAARPNSEAIDLKWIDPLKHLHDNSGDVRPERKQATLEPPVQLVENPQSLRWSSLPEHLAVNEYKTKCDSR